MSTLIVSVLMVTGGLLVVLAGVSRQPPTSEVPSVAGYGVIWQEQHHAPDVDPAHGTVGAFLRLTYALAAPLARIGIRPDVLTIFGLWLAGAAVVTARIGPYWPLLSALVVVISALTDGVDGCVAGLTMRASQRGYVLDSVVDRISDALFVVALVVAGGASRSSYWAGVAAVGALMMLEYLRARAGNAGQGEVGVVTVGERPTRVIAAAIGLTAIGVRPSSAAFIATGSLMVMVAAGAVGFIQLAWHLGRTLDH